MTQNQSQVEDHKLELQLYLIKTKLIKAFPQSSVPFLGFPPPFHCLKPPDCRGYKRADITQPGVLLNLLAKLNLI